MIYANKINSYNRQFQDLYNRMYPEYINSNKKGNSLVKNITFVVTEDCTLRCTYCYQCNKNFKAVMTEETAFKAIDMLLEDTNMGGYISSKESKCVILEFIGGEPLLKIDLIDKIVDYFRYKATILNHPWKNNYMISMTSNGTEYFNNNVQKFLLKNKTRVSLSITIDGDKQLHDSCRVFPNGKGSYDVVVKAIKDANKNLGLRASKVTIAPENVSYLAEAIKHLISLGLTDINANCVYEDVWDNNIHPQILYKQMIELADYYIDEELYKTSYCSLFDENIGVPMDESENDNWCGGNGQMLAIGTDGKIFPCLRFMKYSLSKNREEYKIGNIIDGIYDVNKNKKINQLWSVTRCSQSSEECIKCKVAKGCAWCTGYNYDVYGTPNKRTTFICWMHKARVLANNYFWNRLYEKEGMKKTNKLYLNDEEINYIKGDKY